jgi:hypothetical protein
MHPQLNYIVARQRGADLQTAAERVQLASPARRPSSTRPLARLRAQLIRLTARSAPAEV